MFAKSSIIILIGICAIIVAAVFCYAVFVKPEPNIPIQPVVNDDNIIDNKTNEDDITKDWKTYQNEEDGFEIKYPKDWKVSDGFRPIVFAPKDNPAYTVSANYSYLTTDNLDIDKEIEYYKNKGTFVSSFEVENGVVIKFKEQTKGGEIPTALIAKKGCTIYVNYEAFGTFSNDEYHQYKKVYDQMLTTFKFIEPIDTSDWKVYTNEEYGFEIKYPSILYFFDCSKDFYSYPLYICLTPYVEDNCNTPWKAKASVISISIIKDFSKDNIIDFLDKNIKEKNIIVGNKSAVQISCDREVVGDEGERSSSPSIREMVYTIIPIKNNISIEILYHRIVSVENDASGFYVGKDLSEIYNKMLSTFKFTKL